jgi:excisionase family DNA binding protein
MASASVSSVLVRVKRMAELLDISERKAWQLIACGAVPTVRLGGRCVRVRVADVQALADRLASTGRAPLSVLKHRRATA